MIVPDGGTQTYRFHLDMQARGQVVLREGPRPPRAVPPATPARIARLVALAHRIEGLVRGGEIKDFAEAAAVGGVSRARVSQIVNLLLLAPSIQEELLFMTRPATGRELLGERDLRPLATEPDWKKQGLMFQQLLRRTIAARPGIGAKP